MIKSDSFLGVLMGPIVLPGLIGEGALTVWLLIVGVDVPKWESMNAGVAMPSRRQSS